MVRVRFAPSPTGYLHIGGARTALFNWLFAKKMNGTYILRIEDTDEVRSTAESVGGILESLRWMGFHWDEGPDVGGKYGPYFQMQRQESYKKYANQLLEEGKAYHCFCTPEELDSMRRQAQLQKIPPKYDGRCRRLSPEEAKKSLDGGRPHVLRYKMPLEGVTEFHDMIHGTVSFENKLLQDFVIVKSSGIPTYNFACVIDDHLMEITHVIRGDDHLSNTPSQVQLYQAFGWKVPPFAHLSMILGPDGSRLSKRHGATSVTEYRDLGYLPFALMNYLALLGWSTSDSQQIFTSRTELIEKFDLERCQKSPAVFDPQKLLWMNGEHIRATSIEDLTMHVLPWLENANLVPKEGPHPLAPLERLVALEKEKYKLLSDAPGLLSFLLKEDLEYDPQAVEKVLKAPGAKEVLIGMTEKMEKLEPFNAKTSEELSRAYAKEKGIKTGAVFHPLRVAVSGKTTGPSLFDMLEVLGKEKVLKRIRQVVQKLL